MFNHPDVEELDSGSYEVSLNGSARGYAWFMVDNLGNRTAYFTTPSGLPFPYVVPMDKSISFERIDVSFTSSSEFAKWGEAQLGGSADYHCIIETLIPWSGN